MNAAVFALKSLFSFPELGPGVIHVWRRNFLYFKRTIVASMAWTFFEPLLYLFAIGYGLGGLVKDVNGMPYAEFYAPALMATNAMMVSYFEGTYGSFIRLKSQKTFETIILSPVSAYEVGVAEVLWAASKGFFSTIGVAIVSLALGLISGPGVIVVMLVLALVCWLFAAFGVLMASYAKNYDYFMYAQSGFIIPMSLISGTYFPLSQLPSFIQDFAWLLPLTHGVMSIRLLLAGDIQPVIFVNIAVLLALAVLLTNWATAKLKTRIIH